MDFQTVGETEKVLGGRQSESQPTRETALVCSIPSPQSVDFIGNQYQPQAQDLLQKSLPRLVKVISRIIYWSARQISTKRARSASTSRRSPSPKRDYPRGTCTATRPSQASPKRAEHTLAPAQDLEAFEADMTTMLSDMLQASLSKFA